MRRRMTPNKITVTRVAVAMIAVSVYACGTRGNAAAYGLVGMALTVAAIALDGLDGYLARRMNLATQFGAQLDILGDRVIENLFFICFAVCGEISLLVPVIFFLRGACTDFLRGVAAGRGNAEGKVAETYRRNWMLKERWGSRIVAGRTSRGAYAALKCICFCALGLEWTVLHMHEIISAGAMSDLRMVVNGIVYATATFCIVRAVPVFWEGARDIFAHAQTFAGPAGQTVVQQSVRAASRPMVIAR
jgi:phosphatidylglycerophosphate synthase